MTPAEVEAEDLGERMAEMDRQRAAMEALVTEVKDCHARGVKYYRDTLIEKYGPKIGPDEAENLIGFTVTELDKAAAAEVPNIERENRRIEEIPILAPPPADEAPEKGSTAVLPSIVANSRQLAELTADALGALTKWNQRNPNLFVRAGIPTRIGRDEEGRPMVQAATESMVRHDLARAARFERHETRFARSPGKDPVAYLQITNVPPPLDVVKDLLAVPDLPKHLLPLRLILEAPTLEPDGRLIGIPGYDPESRYYYVPFQGLEMPPIPENPTPEEIRAAALLLYEVIQDFPFVDKKTVKGEEIEDHASEANAIATLITPVLRGMISGPIPLALLDKPQQGSGATLLAEIVAIIATGIATMTTAPKSDEEWEKKILSLLLTGRAVLIFDNIEGRFYAPSLASVLTSTYYEGRILGRSEMASVPQRATWIATGINLQLSGDLPRRCYWVRMDPKMARPWLRKGVFAHPDLKGWVQAERGRIIAAILILGRAWIRAGRPAPKSSPILGGFESWSKTVGGILETAGIGGFLGNLEELYSETDADAPEWAAFLKRLSEEFNLDGGVFTVNSLTNRIKDSTDQALDDSLLGILPEEVSSAWNRPASFSRILGNALRHRIGMRFTNGYFLARGKDITHKAVQWRVMYDEGSDLEKTEDAAGELAGS